MAVTSIDDITPQMIEQAQRVFSHDTGTVREEAGAHDLIAELGAAISSDMVKKGITLEEAAKRLDTSTTFVTQCLNRHGVQDYSAE